MNLFTAALNFYKFTITPLRKSSDYYVFYMFLGGRIAVIISDSVVSVVIIIKKKKQLIELPKPFLTLTKQNQKCQCIIYFAQYLFIMTVLIFALFTSMPLGYLLQYWSIQLLYLLDCHWVSSYSLFKCTCIYERGGRGMYT